MCSTKKKTNIFFSPESMGHTKWVNKNLTTSCIGVSLSVWKGSESWPSLFWLFFIRLWNYLLVSVQIRSFIRIRKFRKKSEQTNETRKTKQNLNCYITDVWMEHMMPTRSNIGATLHHNHTYMNKYKKTSQIPERHNLIPELRSWSNLLFVSYS